MWGGTDESRSIDTICTALDRGITLIDTAPVYGQGRSEEIVGKALQRWGHRDRVVLATKVGLEWTADGAPFRNASRSASRRSSPTPCAGCAPTTSTSTRCTGRIRSSRSRRPRRRLSAPSPGQISAIGVSNYSTEQMEVFRPGRAAALVQPPYNLFEREARERILPYCERHGLVTLTYGALCRGLLSGRMRLDSHFDGDDLRQTDPKFQQPRYAQYLLLSPRSTASRGSATGGTCSPSRSAGCSIRPACRWRSGVRGPRSSSMRSGTRWDGRSTPTRSADRDDRAEYVIDPSARSSWRRPRARIAGQRRRRHHTG